MVTGAAAILYVFRAPLFYAFIFLLIAGGPSRMDLVLYFNQFVPEDFAYFVEQWCFDYFLYPPNSIVLLLGLALGIGILECKKAVFPRSRGWKQNAATLGLCLLMASAPAFFAVRTTLNWQFRFTMYFQIVLYFMFFSANAGLAFFDERIYPKTWFRRLTAVTFPVSDVFFHTAHRDRVSGAARKWRYVLTAQLLGILLLTVFMNAKLIGEGTFAEKLAIGKGLPVDNTFWATWEGDTIWIANANWDDPDAGVWWYDESTGQSGLYWRVFDLNKFHMEEGYLYVHERNRNRTTDGKDGTLVKVDRGSKKVVWRVPVDHAFTYELSGNEKTLLAVGEGGSVYLLDKRDGRILSYLRTPEKSECIQILNNGDVILLNGNPSVFHYDSKLRLRAEYVLPPLAGRDLSFFLRRGHGMRRIATWTLYSPATERLYVSAFWGEVFSLDLASRKWLGSIQVRPGARSIAVDEKNGLLFAANYARGIVEIRDLVTGKLLSNILAGAFGRFINLNPEKKIGILNTKGRGVFRFDYSAFASGSIFRE
jgi:hypothetical protein